MHSHLSAYLLSALMLAALLQCASGAPIEDSSTDSPAGDPSGEEEESDSPSDTLTVVLDSTLGTTKRHKDEFSNEFHGEVKYDFLDHYKIPTLPVNCPYSNFSKEACLHRLLQGLLIYTVLLKRVETEFPSSTIPSEARYYSGLLIREIEKKMRKPDQVTALTSSQEEQLKKALDIPDTFHRKMTAHSVLYKLHYFLIDGKRVIINKRERQRGSAVSRGITPVSFYDQKRKI